MIGVSGPGQPLLKKHFKLAASIESAVTFNLEVQSTKLSDLMLASKQRNYSTVRANAVFRACHI